MDEVAFTVDFESQMIDVESIMVNEALSEI